MTIYDHETTIMTEPCFSGDDDYATDSELGDSVLSTDSDGPDGPSSVLINNLAPTVTEEQLMKLFQTVGSIKSIRILYDFKTGDPLGRAYVNYFNHESATRAIEHLDLTYLVGKVCRVMYSQIYISQKKSRNRLFVKNFVLGPEELYKIYSFFGQLSYHRIFTNKGPYQGLAMVQFFKEEDAERALNSTDGKLIGGVKVGVEFYETTKDRLLKAKSEKYFTNVYVKGFPIQFTKRDLEQLFEQFGKIKSCVIGHNEMGGKQYGFVDFYEHENALSAINSSNERMFSFGKICVSRAQNKTERVINLQKVQESVQEAKALGPQTNLFVKNIDKSISVTQLRKIFEPYGQIDSIRILLDHLNQSRGVGFVCYSDPSEAAAALFGLYNRIVGSKTLIVDYACNKVEQTLQDPHRLSSSTSNFPSGSKFEADNSISTQEPGVFYDDCIKQFQHFKLENTQFSGQKQPHRQEVQTNSSVSYQYNHMKPNLMEPTSASSHNTKEHEQFNFSKESFFEPDSISSQMFPKQSKNNFSQPKQSQPYHPSKENPVPFSALDSYQRNTDTFNAMRSNRNLDTLGKPYTSPSSLPSDSCSLSSKESLKIVLLRELFPLVFLRCKRHAEQITNMMKLLSNTELVALIENEHARESKILQALDIVASNNTNH